MQKTNYIGRKNEDNFSRVFRVVPEVGGRVDTEYTDSDTGYRRAGLGR